LEATSAKAIFARHFNLGRGDDTPMQEADLRFLYDQSFECLVRLRGFSGTASESDDMEFGEDLDHMQELLAKRDLLIASAAVRNFAEATRTVSLMKTKMAVTSELFLSSGVPFHRDAKTGGHGKYITVNLYNVISRVLHARNIELLSDPYDFLARMSYSTAQYCSWVAEYGKSLEKPIDPMIIISTKQEPRTFLLLSRIIGITISYFNDVISKLERDKIYVSRAFRDLG
jgi:hypothetical protein